MDVTGQLHSLAGERAPCTHCTGGWVGPRAGLDAVNSLKKLDRGYEGMTVLVN